MDNFLSLCYYAGRGIFYKNTGMAQRRKEVSFDMKKKRKAAAAVGIIITVLAVGWYFLFYCGIVYQQNPIGASTSPEHTYTIYAYTYHFGAATASSVFCRVKDNKTGKSRNLYRCSHRDSAEISWSDEHTASINGVALNVETDFYSGPNSLYDTTRNTDKSILYIAKGGF